MYIETSWIKLDWLISQVDCIALWGRSQTTFTRQGTQVGGCPNVNKCQQGVGRWSVLCQH